MSVFERIQYNFDSNNFGSAQYLPEETINGLRISTTGDLYNWQKERLSVNTTIEITEYKQNPVGNICNGILDRINSIIAVTESPPADWTMWVSGTANPPLLLAAAQDIFIKSNNFSTHTANLAGISKWDFPDPNVPTYDTAVSYGRQALNILYQTDEIANSIPILGSFTSLFIQSELESANSKLYSSEVNSFIANPAAADAGVVTRLTANLNSIGTLLETRRLHDWAFFYSIKSLVNDYLILKKLSVAGKSNTEYNLIDNFIGTEIFKQNLADQIEEASLIEYNREYVNSGGFGTGGPNRPPPGGGPSTEPCTVPAEPPQFVFNFVDSGGGGGPGTGGTTTNCVPGTYAQIVEFNNPSAGRRFTLSQSRDAFFAIKVPAANRFTSLGWPWVPKKISLAFTSPAPASGSPQPPGWEIFVSECPGNFTTPVTGNNVDRCRLSSLNTTSSNIDLIVGPLYAPYLYAISVNPDKDTFVNIKLINVPVESATRIYGYYVDFILSQ